MQIKAVAASGAMSVAEEWITTGVGYFSSSSCGDGTNSTVEALLLVEGWHVPAVDL